MGSRSNDKYTYFFWFLGNIIFGLLQVWLFFLAYYAAILSPNTDMGGKLSSINDFSIAFSNSVFLFFAMSTLGQVVYTLYSRDLIGKNLHTVLGIIFMIIICGYCVIIYIMTIPLDASISEAVKSVPDGVITKTADTVAKAANTISKDSVAKIYNDIFVTVIIIVFAFYVEMFAKSTGSVIVPGAPAPSGSP